MSISTLGEAQAAGWRVVASCREPGCHVREGVDMRALLWRSGRAFPLALLSARLRCPRCGSRDIRVAFDVPPVPRPQEEGAGRYLIEHLDLRGRVMTTLARDRLAAAEGDFQAMVAARPNGRFVLRDGGRILHTHPPRKT